jgi:pyrrolidone-carboxylate peptidase
MLLPLIIAATMTIASYAGTPISPRTNLGKLGNLIVAKRFEAYKKAYEFKGCKAQGAGHRILLTGFGLFVGVNYNISGAVVSSMASLNFWPAIVDLDNLPTPLKPVAENGVLRASDLGVKIINRSVILNNQNFEICFVTADVKWDLTAAIFIDQATKFKPELILMTGRGADNVSMESAAINNAGQFPGYDEEGIPLNENQPVRKNESILSDYPFNASLPLTWLPREASNEIDSQISELGYKVELPEQARKENNYICNNVSFVLAHAGQNKVTSLAGGAIVLPSPKFLFPPKVGFFHFPSTDVAHPKTMGYDTQIFKWCSVVARTIISQFK